MTQAPPVVDRSEHGDATARRLQLHLIVGCEVTDADVVADYVGRLGQGPIRIIGNDHAFVRQLVDRGCDAVLLDDAIPIDSEADLAAYENAYVFLGELSRMLDVTRYRGVSLFSPVEVWLFNVLVLLEKAMRLLRTLDGTHAHAVFAMSAYEHSYLALWDLAQEDGRVAAGDLCMKVQDGRLSPWSDYPSRRIEARLQASIEREALTFRDLMKARRGAWVPGPGRFRAAAFANEVRVTTIFFVNTNLYVLYLKPMFPIFREFDQRSEPYTVLTLTASAADSLSREGVPAHFVDGLESDGSDPRHYRLLHDEALRRLQLALAGAATVYADSNPLGAAALRYCTGDYFLRNAIEHLRLIDTLIDLFRRQRPRSLMVCPDTIPRAQTAIGVARRFRIPAVTTLSASVSAVSRHLGVYWSDVITVAGEDDFRAFLEAGYDSTRVIVTGSPMFDRIANASLDQDRHQVSQRLPLDRGKRIVVVAASRVDPNESRWIQALGRAARRRGDVQVVVKAHPNYSLARYADAMDLSSGLPVQFIRDIDIHLLLNIAAVVVTDYSHAGREALLFGRPLMVVNTTPVEYPANRFDELGVALLVRRLDEVGAALDRVLDDERLLTEFARARANVVVPRYNHLNDGRAAERIFDILARGARGSAENE